MAVRTTRLLFLAVALWAAPGVPRPASAEGVEPRAFSGLKEINPPAPPGEDPLLAVVGARLVDGRGGPPVPDSVVVVRGPTIVAAGPRGETAVPEGAEVVDGSGLSVTPGLIDAHFHHNYNDPSDAIVSLVLSHGVTTVRDPGHPIRDYRSVRDAGRPMPRCFLTGKHLDQEPHAHPHDAVAVHTADEVRAAVARHLADGASAIKVYYRLPLGLIGAACDAAHANGVPVTAHLELVDAGAAVRAGLDGVEHVTSFGTALADDESAARFRTEVTRDNAARNDGRYRLWAGLDLDPESNPRVRPLIDLMVERGAVLSPTLTVFERRAGDKNVGDFHVRGFEKMMKFTGMCHRAGVPVVVGSHTSGPHAARGWAYQREVELLVECGLTPAEAVVAATSRNARFLGCADRLGTVEPGKLADLLLIEGDPHSDPAAWSAVRRVMLNGHWVGGPADAP